MRQPLIAREGWVFVGASLAAAALATAILGWIWAAVLWVIALFVLQFFRDPPRTPPPGEGVVASPADGKVVFLGEAADPYLDRTSLKISVFMNVFSVHSNRIPEGGSVKARWYHAGRFLNAALDKASEANERNALWIETSSGADIVCVQVAGLVARRILCYVDEGDRVERGQRFGFIRFGSRVDVYLPRDAEARVKLGQWVSAGSDPLARLN